MHGSEQITTCIKHAVMFANPVITCVNGSLHEEFIPFAPATIDFAHTYNGDT